MTAPLRRHIHVYFAELRRFNLVTGGRPSFGDLTVGGRSAWKILATSGGRGHSSRQRQGYVECRTSPGLIVSARHTIHTIFYPVDFFL